MVHIEQLLPTPKLRSALHDLDAPLVYIDCCVSLIGELKRNRAVALGYRHNSAVVKYKDYNAIGRKKDVQENASPASHAPQPVVDSQSEAQSVGLPRVAVLSRLGEVDQDRVTALVRQVTSDGAWNNLKGSAEVLLVHAAYIVCPYEQTPERVSSPGGRLLRESAGTGGADGSDWAGESDGFTNLRLHLCELQLLSNDELGDERKRAVMKERFAHAKRIVEPLLFTMRANGVVKVVDMIRHDLKAFPMHEVLRDQVEAMLNVTVMKSIRVKNSKHERTFNQGAQLSVGKGQKALARGAATSSSSGMKYDPRYQRSPFDPSGRPARLSDYISLVKKSEDNGRSGSDVGGSGSVGKMGSGLRGQVGSGDLGAAASGTMTSLDSDIQSLPGGLWSSATGLSSVEEEESGNDTEVEEVGEVEGSRLGSGYAFYAVPVSNEKETLASLGESAYSVNHPGSASVRFGVGLIDEDSGEEGSHSEEDVEDVEDVEEETRRSSDSLSRLQKEQTSSLHQDQDQVASAYHEVNITASDVTPDRSQRMSRAGRIPQGNGLRLSSQRGSRIDRSAPSPLPPMIVVDSLGSQKYVCSHAGCGLSFSRAYTLKIHEKSHELQSSYHDYKRNPMLLFDPDTSQLVVEQRRLLRERISLPPVIRSELAALKLSV